MGEEDQKEIVERMGSEMPETQAPMPTPVTELYGTAEDGTDLHWNKFSPTSGASEDETAGVLAISGGHWVVKNQINPEVIKDLVAWGYYVYDPMMHLAPPLGNECQKEKDPCGRIDGQVGDGRYPQQTDDLEMATKVVGGRHKRKAAVGGSAGGYEAAWLIAKGLVDVAICLSPATDLVTMVNEGGQPGEKATNYAKDKLEEASPISYVDEDSGPNLIIAFTNDQMPQSQFDAWVKAYMPSSVEFRSILMPGGGHSWAGWAPNRDKIKRLLDKYLK